MSKNEAALKLARTIAAKDADDKGAPQTAIIIREGNADDTISVRCALAAILEVTERAAAKADDYDEWCGGWGLVKNLNAASQGASEVATALRNLEHLA